MLSSIAPFNSFYRRLSQAAASTDTAAVSYVHIALAHGLAFSSGYLFSLGPLSFLSTKARQMRRRNEKKGKKVEARKRPVSLFCV